MKSVERRKALRTYSLLFIVNIIIFASGCDAPPSTTESPSKYVLSSGKINNFYVLSSDLDDAKKPRYIKYLFTGQLQINTQSYIRKWDS